MPETRTIEIYRYPVDIPPSEKTAENAKKNNWITLEPYEVSDEELEREQKEATLSTLRNKPKEGWTNNDIKDMIEGLLEGR